MSSSEVRFIEAAGRRLEYSWYGPAPGVAPTMIFLHEGLGCRGAWRDFPAAVAEATGYGAMAYSRAGYGASDRVTLPRPASFMHDEGLEVLPALIHAAGIRTHILIGHSDGASIAIVYAGGTPATGLRAMVLMAPHVFVEDISIHSIALAAEKFRTTDLAAKLRRWHGDNTDCAFWGWNQAWLDPAFRHWNIEEYLARIRVPVLVIQGERDEYGTGAQVRAIERQARAESLMIPHCGHSPWRDQRRITLEAITPFLRRLPN